MIVQKRDNHLLLITQPAHAALSAALMASWRADGLPSSPRRDAILFATLHHDDGWLEVDRAPIVGGDGAILDFVSSPEDVRLGIWPRAVDRLSATPYVAALVAQHALHIYEPYRSQGRAGAFLAEMEALRDRHLDAAAPLIMADLAADYFFVRMGDTLSLVFCNAWTGPRQEGRYHLRLTGSHVIVDPDPLEGRDIDFAVEARRIRNQPYDARQASEAFAEGTVVTLRGSMSGPPRRSQ